MNKESLRRIRTISMQVKISNSMKIDYVIKNIKKMPRDKQLELFHALIAELACT